MDLQNIELDGSSIYLFSFYIALWDVARKYWYFLNYINMYFTYELIIRAM